MAPNNNLTSQFGSIKPVRSGEGMSCAECEAMLMDAIDGVLSPKDQAAFDLHIATCAECSQMLADARRGAALLEMLRSPKPEPSALLYDRIIAATSGAASTAAVQPTSASPAILPFLVPAASDIAVAPAVSNVLPFRPAAGRYNLRSVTHTMMQPRLAMTAAMAFFSIALTMNLTGIHLSSFRPSDLTPSNLKHSFYQADASVTRYYDNLRVVYELESRVGDLKRTNDSDNPPVPASDQKPDAKDSNGAHPQKKAPKSGSGTSQRRSIFDQDFKLAVSPRMAPVQELDAAIFAQSFVPTNKSKEVLLEGERV